MATSIIDGTLTAADILRSAKGITMFKSLTFTSQGGSSEILKNHVVQDSVATTLKPGASGRFYLFSAAGVKGVHGVRLADGTAMQAFPEPNKQLGFVVLPLGLLGLLFGIFVPGAPWLVAPMALIGLSLFAVGAWLTHAAKQEALAQFAKEAAPPRNVASIVSN